MFSGINNSMSTLHLLSDAKSRSVSPENFTGEKGKGGMATEGTSSNAARDLGQGWKMYPKVVLQPGETTVLADIEGPGAIQHIWCTIGRNKQECWRDYILRFYWDDMEYPSVEVPFGDFFCNGWSKYSPINSLPVCVNPARGFNCYWTMPFKKRAKITIESRRPDTTSLFYQIDYTLAEVDDDCAYFCASFRRSNPTVGSIHTIVDGIKGKGQYVGTYFAWQPNNNGWWGEGEIKFYMDGDTEFPTICGTGTEDYICGAYDWVIPGEGYTYFSTPYSGLHEIHRPDGVYLANTRFGMYRWHITDPIRFENDLRVTIQDLGHRSEGRYYKQQSDISTVAFWYQTLPNAEFPPIGTKDELEIV